MKKNEFRGGEDGPRMGAVRELAAVLGISRAGAYELVS